VAALKWVTDESHYADRSGEPPFVRLSPLRIGELKSTVEFNIEPLEDVARLLVDGGE
jgi:hypothetical protein